MVSWAPIARSQADRMANSRTVEEGVQGIKVTMATNETKRRSGVQCCVDSLRAPSGSVSRCCAQAQAGEEESWQDHLHDGPPLMTTASAGASKEGLASFLWC
jgi:hypothetical protein